MIVVVLVIVAVVVGVVLSRVRRRKSADPLPVGITYLARPRERRTKRTRVYL